MCFALWERAACVLAHLIGAGVWGQLLYPEHLVVMGLVLFGIAGAMWSFCLGKPLPVVPVFAWLFGAVFWAFARLRPLTQWRGRRWRLRRPRPPAERSVRRRRRSELFREERDDGRA